MKIALINGSPKTKDSASAFLLEKLQELIEPNEAILSHLHFSTSTLSQEEMALLLDNDILVFAFPLYIDAIPSHLLHCLALLEDFFTKNKKEALVYSLVNCGFYEGSHNKVALEIMENWTLKSGLTWGQGLGIGGGPMLSSLKSTPLNQGPMKNLGQALGEISHHILTQCSKANIFIEPNFPKLAYKLSGEMGWRQRGKLSGLSRKDLFTQK